MNGSMLAVRGGILALAFALGSCAPHPPHAPPAPVQLRVPIPRDIRTLDPGSPDASEIVTFGVLRLLFEGLVDYDPETLDIVPRLARAFSSTEDDLEWIFRIRRGVRFLDDPCFPGGRGREVTPEDARYSIERSLALLGAGPGEGSAGRPDLPCIAELTVEPPDGLRIRLEHPDPILLHWLAGPAALVVAHEAVERYGADLREHPVGSGPFRLAMWSPTRILLVRRSGFRATDPEGRRLPYLDALHLVNTSGMSGSMYRLYVAGALDMFCSYSRLPARRGAEGRIRGFVVPWLNTIFASFHFASRHPVVTDPGLRSAVAHLDVGCTDPIHVPARGLLPPGLSGLEAAGAPPPPPPPPRAGIEETRARLARAGHPGGKGLPPLRIAWTRWDSSTGERLAAHLTAAGVPVDLEILDDAEFGAAVREGRADLFRSGWVADYPDPQNFLQIFHSASRFNAGGYRNPRYDRIFEELHRETDPVRRADLVRRMEAILEEDPPAIFLRHERETQFVSPDVHGWEHNCTNPTNVRHYECVWVERRGGAGGGGEGRR